jgi:hypothetical protein
VVRYIVMMTPANSDLCTKSWAPYTEGKDEGSCGPKLELLFNERIASKNVKDFE